MDDSETPPEDGEDLAEKNIKIMFKLTDDREQFISLYGKPKE